jgi:hypothetical protein
MLMGRNTPDPRKKAWKDSTPSPHKEKTFFEPLSENALKNVSEDVIRSKIEQLNEVEESYKKHSDISATDYGRAMGIKGTAPQKDMFSTYRNEMVEELERRKKTDQVTD